MDVVRCHWDGISWVVVARCGSRSWESWWCCCWDVVETVQLPPQVGWYLWWHCDGPAVCCTSLKRSLRLEVIKIARVRRVGLWVKAGSTVQVGMSKFYTGWNRWDWVGLGWPEIAKHFQHKNFDLVKYGNGRFTLLAILSFLIIWFRRFYARKLLFRVTSTILSI